MVDGADLFEEKRAAGDRSDLSLNQVRAAKQKQGQFQEGEEQLAMNPVGWMRS